jgi:RNA polymerase sigma-54 factor
MAVLAPRIEQSIELRVDQRVIQTAHLLQCNTLELESAIEEELEENPALERIETVSEGVDYRPPLGGKHFERVYDSNDEPLDLDRDPLSNAPDGGMTLREYLSRELHAQLPEYQYAIAEYILDSLDEHGLLLDFSIDRASLETGASAQEIEEVLRVVQSLDPPGIGARSVQECMLLQLRYLREQGQGNPLAEKIVENYFHRLLKPPVRRIARELKARIEEVEEAIQYIKGALHPYPAHQFRTPWEVSSSYHDAIQPDVIIRRSPEGFEVEIVRPSGILIVSPQWREQYEKMKKNPAEFSEENIRQIRDCVERAERFLNVLEIRYRTLMRVTRAIISRQMGFLETGSYTFLKPLTRTEIAAQLDMHESTISRAVSNKWVQLPNGDLIPFSDFFTPALSIRQAIQEVIHSEDPEHPYSDEQVADILYQRWGIQTSRRTVAKHRIRLHIPSSKKRRKLQ